MDKKDKSQKTTAVDNPIASALDQRISRRQALSTGAKAGIGVAAVVIVGAAGYVAYTASQTTSTTTPSSSISTTPTSSSTSGVVTSSTSSGPTAVSTFTGTDTTWSGVSSTGSASWAYYWPTPSSKVNYDQWAFRSDLVQLGVSRYQEQMNENINHQTVTGDYPGTVTTQLLAGDVDVLYVHPQDGATEFAKGLIQDISGIRADYPNGRILHGVDEIRTDIMKAYPGFITDFTTPDGKNYYGIPYFQSTNDDLEVNGKMAVAAGLQDANDYTKNSWAQSYDDMWAQLPAIVTKGLSQNPYMPGDWWVPFPGNGISSTLVSQMSHKYGINSLYTSAPNIQPAFDTNTSIADLLKQWKAGYDQNLVYRSILTTTNEADVTGEFGSGNHLYFTFIQYDIRAVNDPQASKIAGQVHPVPPGKQGWGTSQHAGFGLRAGIKDPAYLERAQAFITWMSYKDRTGEYFEGLNIAAFGGIAALTGYIEANTSDTWKTAQAKSLPDPANEAAVFANVASSAVTDISNTAPWAGEWVIDLTSNLPAFLTGTQDLNTTIATLRTDLTKLIAKYSTGTSSTTS